MINVRLRLQKAQHCWQFRSFLAEACGKVPSFLDEVILLDCNHRIVWVFSVPTFEPAISFSKLIQHIQADHYGVVH